MEKQRFTNLDYWHRSCFTSSQSEHNQIRCIKFERISGASRYKRFRFCRKRREFVRAFIRKSSPPRSINFRPDETKVAEQDRAECFEALATDRLNNQPLPAKGKNVFFGKVTARSWVNALRSSRRLRLRLKSIMS